MGLTFFESGSGSSSKTLMNISGIGSVLVTSFTASDATDAIIKKALDGKYYVTSFGSKITTIEIRGMMASAGCGMNVSIEDAYKGIYSFFTANKAGKGSGISVTQHSTTFSDCMTTHLQLSTISNDQYGQHFSFILHMLGLCPDATSEGSSGGDGNDGGSEEEGSKGPRGSRSDLANARANGAAEARARDAYRSNNVNRTINNINRNAGY